MAAAINSEERHGESTDPIDRSDYVYNISQRILDGVCFLMNENDLWKQIAEEMGFSNIDITVS